MLKMHSQILHFKIEGILFVKLLLTSSFILIFFLVRPCVPCVLFCFSWVSVLFLLALSCIGFLRLLYHITINLVPYNNTHLLPYSSLGKKFKMDQQGCISSGCSRREFVCLPFPVSRHYTRVPIPLTLHYSSFSFYCNTPFSYSDSPVSLF